VGEANYLDDTFPSEFLAGCIYFAVMFWGDIRFIFSCHTLVLFRNPSSLAYGYTVIITHMARASCDGGAQLCLPGPQRSRGNTSCPYLYM